jgi:hypothetical protein
MNALIDFIEWESCTDFASLGVVQRDVESGSADTFTYAASSIGIVGLIAGTKHADIAIRLERWDGRPPPADDDWEDRDELPWESVQGGGELRAVAFEGESDGLDLTDIKRWRVEILAAGRHRYDYSDFIDELEPERWLLRFWPDLDSLDALAGPPRRCGGPGPMASTRDPWQAAVHGWAEAGWRSLYNSVTAFQAIDTAVLRIGRPFQRDELVDLWGPSGLPLDRAGQYTWSTPVIGHGHQVPAADLWQFHASILDALTTDSGLPAVATFDDAFQYFVDRGLLAEVRHDGAVLYTPNPKPTPAWQALRLTETKRRHIQQQALGDYRAMSAELENVLRWAPTGTVSSTPRALATRLAAFPSTVIGGLKLLQVSRTATILPDPTDISEDSAVEITWASPAR